MPKTKKGKPKKKGLRTTKMLGGPVRYKDGWQDKFEKLMTEHREKLSERYGFTQDYNQVETPEGYPSFLEFMQNRESDNAYEDALPLEDYQNTYMLGPLAYQNWKGKQGSPDGKSYKTPYLAGSTLEVTKKGKVEGLTQDSQGVDDFDAKMDRFGNYKEPHRREKLDNTFIDKVKQGIGNVFPPANILLAGGASTGGKNIDEAAQLAYGVKQYSDIYKIEKRQKEIENWMIENVGNGTNVNSSDFRDPSLNPFLEEYDSITSKAPKQANQALLAGTPSILAALTGDDTDGLVVPTPGFMFNPLNKRYRQQKKTNKKELKSAKERYNSGREQYTVSKSNKELTKNLELYQQQYGVSPAVKENTIGLTPKRDMSKFVIPTNPKRGENRNPIYLKDGGKVKVVKYKDK